MKKILIITIIFLSLFFIADYKIQAQTSCSKDSLEISFDENKQLTQVNDALTTKLLLIEKPKTKSITTAGSNNRCRKIELKAKA